ncbi:MAG: hypothetical protein ACHQWU_10225 [Gemmatimonadales bacterium]
MSYPVRSGVAAIVFAGVAGIGASAFNRTPTPLIVHEWGTITTVHAAAGTPAGCLNRISGSDPLPDFVHRFEPAGLTVPPGSVVESPGTLKRVPLVKTPFGPCRPDVTMRLETPVVYFHPAAGAEKNFPPFDVTVNFRGGVLNEFYPDAAASVSADVEESDTRGHQLAVRSGFGQLAGQLWNGVLLDSSVVGKLRWSGVSLEESTPLPETAAHVWLAPRNVHAARVRTSAGEGEQYLFYRGVAHLDAVMQTRRSAAGVRLLAPADLGWLRHPSAMIGAAWVIDVRANGSAAFRTVGPIGINKSAASAELANVPPFAEGDYTATAIADLRASMKRSLVAAGLFDDEAAAMLETWSDSYFRSPGMRVFYLVPREWTDYFLPLDISIPTTLTRVLVGRIDLG